ncbi:NADH dehydrogenase [ubiquinone] 1 alpha subcomplex subunit 7 [Hyalella azteca]|uniref:NADH dehydrogenase [ubiquinone] 1 alpha subcomplex subunit 7 n=1 Tax=Hyalella azteca TaxID=294128 RepID=A0A8B7NVK8_HYAAZ|nr:NADH dehydrogenase [ubiquinone] 1 alpha subcomplex subunit 7 [Hyalella azteca]XP_018017788.1 NADH dehydrogenase [ubiquinone] 1 alpha subcomplex subunit 7 [Hyalella azteca]XP_047738212.1 NADH dehydrogenase [ubiquinone] 1 alpha subcomplex subunit 7 [Hyalella azteca]
MRGPIRVPTKDVSPFLKKMRAVLLGRDPVLNNRWPVQQSAHDQPPPNLPAGCSHKLHSNYYYTRDGRRLVNPDEVVAINTTQSSVTKLLGEEVPQIQEGEVKSVTVTQKKPKIPGVPYNPPYTLNV